MNKKRHVNFTVNAGFVPNNVMHKAFSHEKYAMLMAFFFLLLFFKAQIGCVFLKDVTIHATSSCLLFDSYAWQFWMTIVEPFDI